MPLAVIHDRLAVSAVLFAGVCAVWGFINYLRGQDMTSGYWGALVICEILMIVQALFGIILAIEGNHPPRAIVHYLYGISAVISNLVAGTYDVGMVGDDDGNGNWNNNERGYVSVIVLN